MAKPVSFFLTLKRRELWKVLEKTKEATGNSSSQN
jgi:hypothetical protein